MTKKWSPPHPSFHLRIFFVCLVVLFASLAGILFGVRLDATVNGSGVFEVRDRVAVRAPATGAATLGWYETDFIDTAGATLPARLDASGNGHVNQHGRLHSVVEFACTAAIEPQSTKLTFHPLHRGEAIWPGQVVGVVLPEPLADELRSLRRELKGGAPTAGSLPNLLKRLDQIEARWAKPRLLNAPKTAGLVVASTTTSHNRFVKTGEVLFHLAPKASQFVARIDVPEAESGLLRKGQTALLTCATHKVRLYGKVEATVEKIDTSVRKSGDGERYLRVWASVPNPPFALRAGVSFDAKIIVGQKRVYRIILER